MITLTGNEALQARLARLQSITQNTRPTMIQIGEYIKSRAALSLRASKDSEGNQFAPLSPKTKRGRQSPIQTLVDTSALSRITYSAGENSVQIGTNAHSTERFPYPIVHQLGASFSRVSSRQRSYRVSTPKRAFLPIKLENGGFVLTPNVQAEVLNIVNTRLTEALRG